MIRTYNFHGDSLTAGVIEACSIVQGGLGGFVEILAMMLGLLGMGPLISPGMIPISTGLQPITPIFWSFTSGADAWTATNAATDAHARLPQGYGRSGTGINKRATFTYPTKGWAPCAGGFDLWWIDIAGGGNWSYSLDGGASWLAMGQTRLGNNKLCKFYVSTPITSTLIIRCADTAGTDVLCCPAGVTPYWFVPQNVTDGWIINNFSTNGATLALTAPTPAGGGDTMAVLDDVRLGTGNPISSSPNSGTFWMFINDVQAANTTTWQSYLTSANTRSSPLGPVYFGVPWEVETVDYNQTQQTNYRATTISTAAGFATPATCIDFYTEWSRMGYTGNAASAPYLADLLHPNQAGNFDIAKRVYGLFRNALGAAVSPVVRSFRIGSSYVGGTDVLGGIPGQQRALTESALGSDSLTRQVADSRAITGTALGTDSLARALADSRALTDQALGGDGVAASSVQSRALTGTALGTDSLARQLAVSRSLTDVGLGADAVAPTGQDTRTGTDTALGSDALARTVGDARAAAETALGTDSLARALALVRQIGDAALGGDVATGGGAGTVFVSDQALGADSVTRTAAGARALSDSGLGGDAVARMVAPFRSSVDLALGGDSVARALAGDRALTDLGLGDDAAAGTVESGAQLRTLADTALSIDTLIRHFTATRTLHDDGLGGDNVTGTIPGTGGAPSSAGVVVVRRGPSVQVAVRSSAGVDVAVRQGATVTVAVGGSQ